MSLDPATREHIEEVLKEHPVVLFMKGNRKQPMCGFSAATSRILNDLLPEYHTVDVLADPEIRAGIKEYGNWPTIPQLYVKGELVGGADIIGQMYASGELNALLGLPAPDRTPPVITITEKAADAIRDGISNAGAAVLFLDVDTGHNAHFRLADAGEHDIIATANGLEVHFDPGSARRAEGITIDWVDSVQGAGLTLRFPGASEVKPMTVAELKARLDAGTITLVDVRPAKGREKLAPLPQARILEVEGIAAIHALPKDTELAFICMQGISSKGVAEQFAAHGFEHVYNVEGGMTAWAEEIDAPTASSH